MRLKTCVILFLLGGMLLPLPVAAISLDFVGAAQTMLSSGYVELRKLTKDAIMKLDKQTEETRNAKNKEVEADEFKIPDSLTSAEDLMPMVTLKEMRNTWGSGAHPTIMQTEANVGKYYLINPDTLQQYSEYGPGGSKSGQKMPDTSETPNTVRAQQKQYLISLLRGQAVARTLMKRTENMDKTISDLQKLRDTRETERELYHAIAILTTQTDYLMNNLVVVRGSLAEIESIQTLQGTLMDVNSNGAGIVGTVVNGLLR